MTFRIAFYIWSLGTGGAERHTVDLANRLGALGFETRVFVHERSGSLDFPHSRTEIVYLNGGASTRPWSWSNAWRAINAYHPNVLFTVNLSATVSALVGRMSSSRPVAMIMHSTALRTHAERARAWFVSMLSRSISVVFCSHRQAKHWHCRGFKGQTYTIHNGVDTLAFHRPSARERQDARAKLGFSERDYVVGMVAAFRPEKDHQSLFAALRGLRRKGHSAKALLVGDGPLRTSSEASAADLGDAVVFVGNQRDVRPYLAAMDVGVISSTAIETFSIAALEAMASGVPMIMTDVGGASEMQVDGVTGLIVPPSNPGALEEALVRLSSSHTRATMSMNARERIQSYFTVERMVDAYSAVTAELIGARNPLQNLDLCR